MRTVSTSADLKPPKPFTNRGRSLLQPKTSHATAEPSSPATDVNVPHSWIVRPLDAAGFRPAAARNPAAHRTVTKPAADFIFSLPAQVLSTTFRFPRQLPGAGKILRI